MNKLKTLINQISSEMKNSKQELKDYHSKLYENLKKAMISEEYFNEQIQNKNDELSQNVRSLVNQARNELNNLSKSERLKIKNKRLEMNNDHIAELRLIEDTENVSKQAIQDIVSKYQYNDTLYKKSIQLAKDKGYRFSQLEKVSKYDTLSDIIDKADRYLYKYSVFDTLHSLNRNVNDFEYRDMLDINKTFEKYDKIDYNAINYQEQQEDEEETETESDSEVWDTLRERIRNKEN